MRELFKLRDGNAPFLVLVGLFVVLALGGGGAREDIESLIYVRPLAAIALGLGLYTLTLEQVRQHKYLFAVMLSACALMLLHVIPLPPSLWTALPGREPIAEAADMVGVAQPWRPLALVPWRAYNSLFALLVPIAALTLAVQLDQKRLQRTVPLLIALGTASALLSLLQVIGPANGPLYLYRITNAGAAVGLFSNRNHAAVLLAMLIPLCAAYAAQTVPTVEQLRRRQFLALACVALVIPLIVIARSRAGLVVALVGFASVALLYRQPEIARRPRRKRHSAHPLLLPAAAVALTFLVVSFLAGRATSLEKFTTVEAIDSTRQVVWSTTIEAIGKFLPLGSGFGSFVETYQLFEPRESLNLNYVNHAHNDYLELLLAAGIPGLLLLAAALWFLVHRGIAVFRRRPEGEDRDVLLMGRLGFVLLFQLGVASLVDYPLRTPIMAATAMLAAVWLARATIAVRISTKAS